MQISMPIYGEQADFHKGVGFRQGSDLGSFGLVCSTCHMQWLPLTLTLCDFIRFFFCKSFIIGGIAHNINFMNNLNAKWKIEQVIIIFERFHAVFSNWIPKN